jgi:hypothetical protein
LPAKPGPPRTVESTIEEIKRQLDQATMGSITSVKLMQTASGVKDRVAQGWILKAVAKAKELKAANAHWTIEEVRVETKQWLDAQAGEPWSLLLSFAGKIESSCTIWITILMWRFNSAGLDPHRDTPIEILHTVLLGIIKYVWHNLHMSWKDTQRDLFVTRLQSTNLHGLRILPIRVAHMAQYRNGLIGKHFKTLMQTTVFSVHGLVTNAQFELIKATGKLGAMLWYHEIPEMGQYIVRLPVTHQKYF